MKRPVALGCLATTIAIGYVVLSAGPALAGPVFNFFHFNVSGNDREEGNDTDNDPDDPVQAIFNSLTGGNQIERAASLNELCKNQYWKLLAKLEPHGWEGRFVETAWWNQALAPDDEEEYVGELCNFPEGTQHDYGNAILVRDAPIDASSVKRVYLGTPESSNEHRALICVTATPDTSGAVATRFCSTHVAPSQTVAQTNKVAQVVDGFNKPVVLMGDFNENPAHDALNPIYASWLFGGDATGKFEEVDQKTETNPSCRCGQATHDTQGKIDYIFFRAVDFQHRSGDVTNAITESDHHILRGKVEAN